MILKASSIITMEEGQPRAEAMAIDTTDGTITAVGSLADVRSTRPSAELTDLGSTVLMPGFIDPHNHPALSGMLTQEPAHWIAPYVGYPSFADVQERWRTLQRETPTDQPLVFAGLDRLLQGAPELTNSLLDEVFGSRPTVVLDNSGHEVYFNSAVMAANGWTDGKPPADPAGARFGRNTDGTSNGRAYETAAVLLAAGKVISQAIPHPLLSLARWFQTMAGNGITTTSEHTYTSRLAKGYQACASVGHTPLRVALYQMSIDPDCGAQFNSPVPTSLLWKQGIKLWADGSPWVGTIASSFPYLDSAVVRNAEIPLGPGGEAMMNYSRAELDEVLTKYTPLGWQFAFHVNGDVGLDIVLDAYERALATHGLLGTDHRWRVEHVGGCRGDQFDRAASLGVTISLLPAQFIYWGDLLDGQMFPTEIGSQWMRAGDAFRSGALVTFHNDGLVSPPIPLLNIQCMVTRRTPGGTLHGPEQQVSLNDAFKAHTINAARQLGREHDLGTIAVGKSADLVELSADPFVVDSAKLTDEVAVQGTWLAGTKVDTAAFLNAIGAIDPKEHKDLPGSALSHRC
ncbi:MAG: amidohydrolase [Actinobacteria bacterium]|nr:amidohydrolase [Actinomycetota bacterium]MCB9412471.1 amidohydrolase [Actinomycetota bacterium]